MSKTMWATNVALSSGGLASSLFLLDWAIETILCTSFSFYSIYITKRDSSILLIIHTPRDPTILLRYTTSFVLDNTIKVTTSLIMIKNISFNNEFYRIFYVDDVEPDRGELNEYPQLQQPGLIWWEEVDREFPLDQCIDMSSANVAGASSDSDLVSEDPVQQAEHLERFGEVIDTPGARKTREDEAANSKNGKRRRSLSNKADSKKQKKQTAGQARGGKPENSAQKPRKQPAPTKRTAQSNRNSKGSGDQVQARLRRLPEREAREKADRPKETNGTAHNADSEKSGDQRNEESTANSEHGDFENVPSAYHPTTEYMRAELSRDPSPFKKNRRSKSIMTPTKRINSSDDITPQGADREAYRRLLEENNPVSIPEKKPTKERVPPERTFEVTKLDMSPLNDDWLIPAEILSRERREEDKKRRANKSPRLKLDSRKLRTGDWIVMAMNEDTKSWLIDLFNSALFTEDFKVTLVSDQADIKYALKVQPPDSKEDNEVLLEHLFQDLPDIGYVRIINDSRNYRDKDGETNKAYHKSIKKRTPFDDKGVPYIKTIWLRLSQEAHDYVQEHWDDLDFGYGAVEMELERVKDKKKKEKKKSTGASDNGNANEQGNESDEEMVQIVENASDEVDEIERDQPVNAGDNNGGE